MLCKMHLGIQSNHSILRSNVLKYILDWMQLVAAPWIQNKRIELAMGRYRINHALHRMLSLGHEQNWGSLFTPTGKPNTETLRR